MKEKKKRECFFPVNFLNLRNLFKDFFHHEDLSVSKFAHLFTSIGILLFLAFSVLERRITFELITPIFAGCGSMFFIVSWTLCAIGKFEKKKTKED